MPRLARVVCLGGITVAFDAATARVEELDVVVAGETVRRMTEALGAVAAAAQQDAIAQVQQGQATRASAEAQFLPASHRR